MLLLGSYPEVSLRQAREKRQKIREQVAAGIDPSTARQAVKATLAGEGSFEALAREWYIATVGIPLAEKVKGFPARKSRVPFPFP